MTALPTLFPYAHASHPQWAIAVGSVVAQLYAQMAQDGYAKSPTLGLLYITDHYAPHAQALLDHLRRGLPRVRDWAGTVGVGVCANNVEYVDEPALCLMLCELSPTAYRVFSGAAPFDPGFAAHTALVHADGEVGDLSELIADLAQRTRSGYVFGGLTASRVDSVQFALSGTRGLAQIEPLGGVFEGGLSGVAFGAEVGLVSRVTQGCLPVAKPRTVTQVERNLVLALDGQPALDVLLADLGVSLDQPEQALARVRATLVGLTAPSEGGHATADMVKRTGNFGPEVQVRHIMGLDPQRRGVAVAEWVQAGSALAFCQRNMPAARADLVRICAEIREELEPDSQTLLEALARDAPLPDASPHPARGIAGAVYVSCSGRGGAHFGGPSAELHAVRRALGNVPLVGFFAGGEIAHQHLYGYTGVLTVFTH